MQFYKELLMYYFELIMLIAFVLFSGFGYVKNNRNVMLLGSFCLVVSLAAEPFAQGFNEGYSEKSQQLKQQNH